MTKIHSSKGKINSVDFHAEVPFLTKPKILGEKLIDGVKHYYNEFKEYQADLFDSYWQCQGGKSKPQSFKGELIGQDLYFTA
jgi:hypothetical protein